MRRPKLVVYKRGDGLWSWQLIANGNVIATDHGQGYAKRHRAREMGERVASGDFSDYDLIED